MPKRETIYLISVTIFVLILAFVLIGHYMRPVSPAGSRSCPTKWVGASMPPDSNYMIIDGKMHDATAELKSWVREHCSIERVDGPV